MDEMILSTKTLPEPLFRMIRTEKVKIREVDGEIRLTPVNDFTIDCPLLGMYSDSKLTVDTFLKGKREDKENKL